MGRKRSFEAARFLSSSQCQEVRQQCVARRRENCFRVELDAPRGQGSMSQCHECPISRPGQWNEIRRQGLRIDDQGVVSSHGQRRR